METPTSGRLAASRRQAPTLLIAGTLAIAFMSANLMLLTEDRNPDWRGYRAVYDTGAWLFYQQRDTGFLALTEFLHANLALTYEMFRALLSLGFVVFLAIFLSAMQGLSSAVSGNAPAHPLWYIGVLPLVLPRFTVQVREGIAIAIVLVALSLLAVQPQRPLFAVLLPIISLALMGVAASIHLAAAIFLLVVVVVLAVALVASVTGLSPKALLNAAAVASVLAVVALSLLGLLEGAVSQYGIEFYGGVVGDPVNAPAEKWAYWGLLAVILLYVGRQIRDAAGLSGLRTPFVLFVRYLSIAILPLVLGTIVVLLLLGTPATIVSAAIRLYESLFLCMLAMVSFFLPKTRLFVLVCLFLIVNSYRVLFTALAA